MAYCHFCMLLLEQTHTVRGGRGYTRLTARGRGPLRVILEVGYYSGTVYFPQELYNACLVFFVMLAAH